MEKQKFFEQFFQEISNVKVMLTVVFVEISSLSGLLFQGRNLNFGAVLNGYYTRQCSRLFSI